MTTAVSGAPLLGPTDIAQQARQARANADALDRQARDLDRARRTATKAAAVTYWNDQYGEAADRLAAKRDAALATWAKVRDDAKASIDTLYMAYTALRVASASFVALRRLAASELDKYDPQQVLSVIGVDTGYTRPYPEDAYVGWTFSDALHDVTTRAANDAAMTITGAAVEAANKAVQHAERAALTQHAKG